MYMFQKEVCTLLLYKKKSRTSQSVDNVPLIVEWFDALDKSFDTGDPLSLVTRNGYTLLVPHLLQLLREFLLSHQWQEAVKVLHGLTREHKNTATTIWKVGLELLYTNPETNARLVDQLINQLKWCSDLNAKEVLLEYAMFLLNQARPEDAALAFMNIPKHIGVKKEPTARSEYIDVLFEAYHGLVYYVEWLKVKSQMEHVQNTATDNIHLQSTPIMCNYEELMKKHCQKALNCFQCLKGRLGIWDIFVTKHLELLEYYSRYEECEDLLESYIQTNSDNPNAYRYLYWFYVKNDFSLDKRKEVLKTLARHVPSDPLVLDLCQLLIQGEENVTCLGYLFDLLDYSVWQQEERPWKMLSEVLLLVLKTKRADMVDTVKTIWDIRSSWWPVYHFIPPHDMDTTSDYLLYHKSLCSLVLFGPGNMYLLNAMKHMKGEQKEELKILSTYDSILPDVT